MFCQDIILRLLSLLSLSPFTFELSCQDIIFRLLGLLSFSAFWRTKQFVIFFNLEVLVKSTKPLFAVKNIQLSLIALVEYNMKLKLVGLWRDFWLVGNISLMNSASRKKKAGWGGVQILPQSLINCRALGIFPIIFTSYLPFFHPPPSPSNSQTTSGRDQRGSSRSQRPLLTYHTNHGNRHQPQHLNHHRHQHQNILAH